jgi:hypothetical protein
LELPDAVEPYKQVAGRSAEQSFVARAAALQAEAPDAE